MRSFRLVDEKTTVPPWTTRACVLGHTFPAALDGPERLACALSLEASVVHFAPCAVGGSDCQTVRISCSGESGAVYAIDIPQEARACFSCVPQKGFIPCGQFRILTFRFTPPSSGKFKVTAKLIVNGKPATDTSLTISLSGQCFSPKISFNNNGRVDFKPTCLGTTSSRYLIMENLTGLDLLFRFRGLERVAGIFQILPASGLIRAHEELSLNCSFTPKTPKQIQAKLPCTVICSEFVQPNKEQALSSTTELAMTGQGTLGSLSVSEQGVQFGDVLVNGNSEKQLVLTNNTHSHVRFHVSIMSVSDTVVGDAGEGEESADETALSWASPPSTTSWSQSGSAKEPILVVNPSSGVVAARSTTNVKIVFRPKARRHFAFTVSFTITSDSRPGSAQASYTGGRTSPPPLETSIQRALSAATPGLVACSVSVSGTGALPTLGITAVEHCDGLMSRSSLWRMLGISAINKELTAEVSPEEKLLDHGEGVDTDSLEACLSAFRMSLGSCSMGSSPTKVALRFTNVGRVPLSFSSYFRDQPQVTHEHWMGEHEDLSEYEHKQKATLARHAFQIRPMAGSLQSGESCTVYVSYTPNPEQPSEDSLGVVLRIASGKSLLLSLCGATLSSGETALMLANTNISDSSAVISNTMHPVSIGTQDVPVQFYALRCCCSSATPVDYSFDLSKVVDLRNKNHGVDVFSCLQPTGTVIPGEATYVSWTFSPLEARQYSLPIQLTSKGSAKAININMHGTGFHPRDETTESSGTRDYRQEESPAVGEMTGGATFPGQLVSIEPDVIDLGTAPIGATVRKLVVLKNVDTDGKDVSFKWECSSANLPQFQHCSVEPASGILRTGGSVLCKMTLYGIDRPAIFDFDIPCRLKVVETDTETQQIQQQKQPTTQKKEEVLVSHTSGVSGTNQVAGPSATTSFKGTATGHELQTATEEQKHKTDILFITARLSTLTLNQYKSAGNELSKFFFFAHQSGASATTIEQQIPEQFINEAAEFAHEACATILNEVLRDPELLQVVGDTSRNQLPFFDQISKKQKSSSLASTDQCEDIPLTPHAIEDPQTQVKAEFEQFAETVLESTLANLMREIAADVWDPTIPPK